MFRQQGPRGLLQGWMWGLGREDPGGPQAWSEPRKWPFPAPGEGSGAARLVGGGKGWV